MQIHILTLTNKKRQTTGGFFEHAPVAQPVEHVLVRTGSAVQIRSGAR